MSFDAAAIQKLGWRQGSVLGPELAREARARAPAGIAPDEKDWLIVTSHHCDVVNSRLEKEPFVEVLRAVVAAKADGQIAAGRNPRQLQLLIADGATSVILSCRVHEKWALPRELLETEAPARALPEKEGRLIAEWLAKRYIRSAFPSAFDARWRERMKEWTRLLEKHTASIQGVYLQLDTLKEVAEEVPYHCDLIIAVPARLRNEPNWASVREAIDSAVEGFWNQFQPRILCEGVQVQGTDELTLASLDGYQRFDADWVSFADETETIPSTVDMGL